jgi:hypothetical protein
MKSNSKKYFSSLFLFSYLIFVGIASFHSHHINVSLFDSKEINSSNPTKFSDPFIDKDNKCTIYFFSGTILLKNYANIFSFNSLTDQHLFLFISSENYSITFFNLSNPLRAPPENLFS